MKYKVKQQEKEERKKKIIFWTKRILLGLVCASIALLLLVAVFATWIQNKD